MAHKLEPRLESQGFKALAPDAAAALGALSRAASAHGLEKPLIELAKIRASQLNGCAFCLQMHLDDARRMHMDEVKLNLVAAWREAPVFSQREHAALAWTEALTLVTEGHVPDAVYEEARQHFSEKELVDLTYAVMAINAWNRIAIAFRKQPILSRASAAA